MTEKKEEPPASVSMFLAAHTDDLLTSGFSVCGVEPRYKKSGGALAFLKARL